MSTVFLPILVFTVPVLAITLIALMGRHLSGSCGGLSADGSCARCGRTAGSGEPGEEPCDSSER